MHRINRLREILVVASLVMTVVAVAHELKSGIEPGGMLPAYDPMHVSGADKNTATCPVCKYPANPAVQAWINTDDIKNVEALLTNLENATKTYANMKLKVFVIFFRPNGKSIEAFQKHLQSLAAKHNLKNVAVAYLDGPDNPAVQKYRINTDPRVKNTIFVYRNRKVETKFVNLVADAKGLASLNAAIKSIVM